MLAAPERELLAATSAGLLQDATVPRERVYSFVGSLFDLHGLRLVPGESTASPVTTVVTKASGARGGPRPLPRNVAAGELQRYAAHPGVFVQTTLVLEHVDPLQLVSGLRVLTAADPEVAILSTGQNPGVVLRGPGSRVAHLARILRAVDRRAAGD